jgi:hypothetical protein
MPADISQMVLDIDPLPEKSFCFAAKLLKSTGGCQPKTAVSRTSQRFYGN